MGDQVNVDQSQLSAQADHASTNCSALGSENSPSLSNTISLDIPAELQYVNILGASICAFLTNIEQLAEPATILYNLELAIQEISVNIATHAYANAPGRINMSATLSYQPLRITIILRDQGTSFDPAGVAQPNFGSLQEHGYGLFLVTELMDEVEYQQIGGENVWRLVKNLPTIANS